MTLKLLHGEKMHCKKLRNLEILEILVPEYFKQRTYLKIFKILLQKKAECSCPTIFANNKAHIKLISGTLVFPSKLKKTQFSKLNPPLFKKW
jgi:hypothetical protein